MREAEGGGGGEWEVNSVVGAAPIAKDDREVEVFSVEDFAGTRKVGTISAIIFSLAVRIQQGTYM